VARIRKKKDKNNNQKKNRHSKNRNQIVTNLRGTRTGGKLNIVLGTKHRVAAEGTGFDFNPYESGLSQGLVKRDCNDSLILEVSKTVKDSVFTAGGGKGLAVSWLIPEITKSGTRTTVECDSRGALLEIQKGVITFQNMLQDDVIIHGSAPWTGTNQAEPTETTPMAVETRACVIKDLVLKPKQSYSHEIVFGDKSNMFTVCRNVTKGPDGNLVKVARMYDFVVVTPNESAFDPNPYPGDREAVKVTTDMVYIVSSQALPEVSAKSETKTYTQTFVTAEIDAREVFFVDTVLVPNFISDTYTNRKMRAYPVMPNKIRAKGLNLDVVQVEKKNGYRVVLTDTEGHPFGGISVPDGTVLKASFITTELLPTEILSFIYVEGIPILNGRVYKDLPDIKDYQYLGSVIELSRPYGVVVGLTWKEWIGIATDVLEVVSLFLA